MTGGARNDDDRLWWRMRRAFRLPASPRRLEAEVDEELQFHLRGRADELMAREGLDRTQAEAEARRRFGDLAHYRRQARDIDRETQHRRRRMHATESIVRESRRAVRTLLRAPAFSAVTVLTLALGIGAATAIFTLLDAVVLRPLPYASADRLVELSSPVPLLKGQTRWGLARHEMFYFLEQGRTLENLAVYNTYDVTLLGSGPDERPERVRWVSTHANLFAVLGFVPRLGRLLNQDDNSQRRPQVAVISDRLWKRRFAADPNVLGRRINVEGAPLTIVGVLPAGADLPDIRVDVWAPAWVDSTTTWNNHTWSAIGRLRPGFTADDAERDLAPLTARLPEAFPQVYGPNFVRNTGFSTEVRPLRDAVVGEMVTRALWTLFGSVALVLLIAAANVANLFLVRIDARRRDVAIRTALGADRSHLAVQYLTESIMLIGSATLLAVGVARALLALLLRLAPGELPRLAEVRLGGTSLLFAAGVALLIAIVFGILPLIGARLDLALLREAGRGLTSSRRRMNARRVLVAGQMAFAVVLLAAAALMLRTFRNLRAIDPGFDPERVLTMQVALPSARYDDQALAVNFHEQLASRVMQLPGVRHVGVTDRLPLVGGDLCIGVTLEGATPGQARGACPPSTRVSPGYFEAIGTRVEGRTLTWAGMNAGDGAIVVSRAFADAHWAGENPIGKRVRFSGSTPPWYTVVGVAENVHGMGLTSPPTQAIYFPLKEVPGAPLWEIDSNMDLVVRTTSGDPMTLASAIARVVGELEPQAAVSNPRTMETVVARSIARQSFTMVLLLISSTMAILLSAVGIYGVVSYVVAQRRGEIGVRVALGASMRDVTGMVLRQSLGVAAIGVALGVVVAVATTRFLGALLHGITPVDPATFTAVPIVLLVVAVVATLIPARRAARVDPVEALRSE